MEYKIGDKVKIIGVQDGLEEAVGLVGVITEFYKNKVNVVFEKRKWTTRPYWGECEISWWYSQDKIEPYITEIPVEDFSALKVGDIVRVDSLIDEKDADYRLKMALGKTGKIVVGFNPTEHSVGIEFSENIGGHGCNGKGKYGNCFYIYGKGAKGSSMREYGAKLILTNGDQSAKPTKTEKSKAEKPKIDITPLTDLMLKGYTYIAKDSDNSMFVYKTKPKMDIGGKQWYVEGYTDCKQFGGFSVKKKKLDFYWGLPVALADIVADIEKYLV